MISNGQGGGGEDPLVDVNHRGLIINGFARYPVKFAVFRELLQNSDDAQARHVEIRFETKDYISKSGTRGSVKTIDDPELRTLSGPEIHCCSVRNDGDLFSDDDWKRVLKIGDGNPNEHKVGGFGVGFYSVFSVTDEPIIISNGKQLRLFFAQSSDRLQQKWENVGRPDLQHPRWTVFAMKLKQPAHLNDVFDVLDLTQFLVSAIAFTKNVLEVSLSLNSSRICTVTKHTSQSQTVALLPSLHPARPNGIMTVKGISAIPVSIAVRIAQCVYSNAEKVANVPRAPRADTLVSALLRGKAIAQPITLPPSAQEGYSNHRVEFYIYSAVVAVKLPTQLASELKVWIGKSLPKDLRYQVVYISKDQYDESVQEDDAYPSTIGRLFQGLRASIGGQNSALIFVGQPTSQTTGIGGHMWSRFIPTSERQSIDLANGVVKVWNEELLYVGGYVSRTIYELELAKVREDWPQGPVDVQSPAYNRALHVVQFFTFHRSSPSPEVSDRLRRAFLGCSPRKTFSTVSSAGIRDLWSLRIFNDSSYSKFIKDWPTLPDKNDTRIKQMIQSVLDPEDFDKLMLRAQDCIEEFRKRHLDGIELVDLLMWFNRLRMDPDAKENQLKELQGMFFPVVRVMTTTADDHTTTFTLSTIRHFVDSSTFGSTIPVHGPLPDNVLAPALSRGLDTTCLHWLGWTPLAPVDWSRHVIGNVNRSAEPKHDITRSPQWAEDFLVVLARAWSTTLSSEEREEISAALQCLPCIPTSAGLVLPQSAFIHGTAVLPRLPVLRSQRFSPGDLVMFDAIGVRKQVDFETFLKQFTELEGHGNDELVQYLLNAPDTVDRRVLQNAPVFEREISPDGHNAEMSLRVKLCELHQPLEVFRRMGLPTLRWTPAWSNTSPTALLLSSLGLRGMPTFETVIKCCSNSQESVHQTAFAFLRQSMESLYSDIDPRSVEETPFIPAMDNGTSRVCKPKDVYMENQWSLLGFPVVHSSLLVDSVLGPKNELLFRCLPRLGVQERPSTAAVLNALRRHPPSDKPAASRLFSFLARYDFGPSDLKALSKIPFIPVDAGLSDGTQRDELEDRCFPPCRCFFGQPKRPYYRRVFGYVDFEGPAKTLLINCGVRYQPLAEDVAEALIRHSETFWEAAGKDQLLFELRKIASDYDSLSSELKENMKMTFIVPASAWKPRKSTWRREGQQPGRVDEIIELKKPCDVIIIDDLSSCDLLSEGCWTHPQDDLEVFYVKLGATLLSNLVKHCYTREGELPPDEVCNQYRRKILERLPLFLHYFGHQPRVPYAKLKEDAYFEVRMCRIIYVRKSIGEGEETSSQGEKGDKTAACAEESDNGITLWITRNCNSESDMMYDVATSLCRLLFEAPKANDFLLFMTMLSTELAVLRQRGYNVDEIIGQMEKQTLELDDALDDEPGPSMVSASSAPSMTEMNPDARMSDKKASTLKKLQNKFTIGGSIFTSVRRRTSPVVLEHQFGHYVQDVMNKCQREREECLRNDPRPKDSAQSSKEEYCNARNPISLTLKGECEGISFYITALERGQSRSEIHPESLKRFATLLLKLGRIFHLQPSRLHVFYHEERGLMGFNRNNAIFLSLYHFEWKHDEQVRTGSTDAALISWYFVMAHEIAHNMFSNHDENHELLFSEICQRYLRDLLAELSNGYASV